ncbi:hypothetical protein, partial [Pseudochrobactrum sp. HB0163]|uniref:hypothetical protein n=1 Tax=Pseudochrobactrum sp. HB0163 TaxID=3450708 RepID=UPI003F6DF125
SLPLAARPPSLWRYIDPHKQNCQHSKIKKQHKTQTFFPQGKNRYLREFKRFLKTKSKQIPQLRKTGLSNSA